mmetsp:Transcript_67056/g.196115  ORF Transcript_67056/g.196115 Transcript_67056/m.196115 type:complete len:205 (-) Transcript_67056:431-1045(-)
MGACWVDPTCHCYLRDGGERQCYGECCPAHPTVLVDVAHVGRQRLCRGACDTCCQGDDGRHLLFTLPLSCHSRILHGLCERHCSWELWWSYWLGWTLRLHWVQERNVCVQSFASCVHACPALGPSCCGWILGYCTSVLVLRHNAVACFLVWWLSCLGTRLRDPCVRTKGVCVDLWTADDRLVSDGDCLPNHAECSARAFHAAGC